MDIFEYLKKLDIAWEKHDHKAVFTVEEAQKVDQDFPGAKTKNLFLRDRKKTKFFLVSTLAEKRTDIRALERRLGVKKLSFGNTDDLMSILATDPGAVSPFALISDSARDVSVIIDKELLNFDMVNFHPPNNNASTLTVKAEDFKIFLESLSQEISYMDLVEKTA